MKNDLKLVLARWFWCRYIRKELKKKMDVI